MVMDVICPNDKATLHWVSGVPSPGGKERSSSSDPSVSLSLMWAPHMIDCVSMNFHVSVSSLARTAVIVTLLQKLPSLANHRSLNTKYGLFSLSSWSAALSSSLTIQTTSRSSLFISIFSNVTQKILYLPNRQKWNNGTNCGRRSRNWLIKTRGLVTARKIRLVLPLGQWRDIKTNKSQDIEAMKKILILRLSKRFLY